MGMRISKVGITLALLICAGWHCQGQSQARAGNSQQRPPQGNAGALPPPFPIDQEYLEWPLPANDKVYGSIDGKQLKTYVDDLVAIPERYRDQGHQFWGRITGSSADTETQQWLIGKFKAAGVSDIRVQTIDLPPQWNPTSWTVAVTGGDKAITLKTAQPVMSTQSTPAGGLDLEVAYVGLGSEADYIGRDVRGKAVFIYSATHNHQQNTALTERATLLAEKKGAAAIFFDMSIPGNVTWELYNPGTHVPTFTTGLEDGLAVRNLVVSSENGAAPRVHIQLNTEMVPNEKTATIWATLPGRTSEKIYFVCHRDGFFDGAADNASGMATMIGLAEYFAKIPKQKRRRTIVFVSTTGHHSNGANGHPHVSMSSVYMAPDHEEIFKDTALLINLEHTATAQTAYYLPQPVIRKPTSQSEALFWFVHGSPLLEKTFFNDLREFGVPVYQQRDAAAYGEIQDYAKYAPSVQATNFGTFSHSDHETADMVPWTGLEGITRAYAKLVADVNDLDTKDLEAASAATDALSPPGTANGGPNDK
jgi:hypothetical protein